MRHCQKLILLAYTLRFKETHLNPIMHWPYFCLGRVMHKYRAVFLVSIYTHVYLLRTNAAIASTTYDRERYAHVL